MTRPVAISKPSLTDQFSNVYTQRTIDKIDLLFMIDNSASMADKQAYLKLAIPDLINRLVSPNCVDQNDVFLARSTLDADGNPTCTSGQLEFAPVHDMHIGIVSSSLGGNGGDLCNQDPHSTAPIPPHLDDKGHLIARGGKTESVIAATAPSSFLAWRPNVPANKDKPAPVGATAITQIADLTRDFEDMVAGVGENGCGLEAQLESWYRFLVQPDPYDSIEPGGILHGIDAELLKQRHDFLRPDSLVAIIDVTDENDSEIDVRSIGGYGDRFVTGAWQPAHANAACAKDPNDANCHSCDEDGHKTDPGCDPLRYAASSSDPQVATDLANLDNANLRHVHMKQRYGVDPQFPLARYKNGLTSGKAPDRDGEYPAGKRSYQGVGNCTNPLFASALPDGSDLSPEALCNLPANTEETGGRLPTSNLVIYAHIGGVPYQLLLDPKTNAPKDILDPPDWEKILGANPDGYDYTGIDPHMIESIAPRPGLAAPTSADTSDPIHGREWTTSALGNLGSDLQYACTFDLTTPRDCTDPANLEGCDCPNGGTPPSHDKLPPLCDPATPTKQIKAKTYPTIRELSLAQAMGKQGVVASLCPIHTKDNATGSDPLFGYRPAVSSIINLIKGELNNQCLPHAVITDANQQAPCLILETEPTPGPESACDAIPGRIQPDADVLARVRADQKAASLPNDADPSQFPVCEIVQLKKEELVDGSCRQSNAPGWCYVTGAAAGKCDQSILFSPTGNAQSRAKLTLQCIESIPTGGSDL